MDRSRRKRKKENVSESWYVGYAEDGESVEAIMKKFEELEQIQKAQQETSGTTELSTTQLEELFKRTSAFTVKSVNLEDGYDALDVFRFEYDQDDDELAEESFWDQPTSTDLKPKPRRKFERSLARYKSVQLQDNCGNYYVVNRKFTAVDSNLPTYIRIPNQLPRSWARLIKPLNENETSPYFRSIGGNIFDFDLKTLGNNYQAILMDPPLLLKGQERLPGHITVEELAKIDIPSLIKNGFLFIWAEKEFTGEILKITAKWGFRYVENYAWIKKHLNNTIACQPSTYFKKSKATCLIFRTQGDLELRHQRNPDCEFDFIKPIEPGSLTEQKPDFMYDVIETLLPTALCSKENPVPEGLLEL